MKKIYRIVFVFSILLGLTACDNFNKLLKSTDTELKLTKAKEYYDKEVYIKSSQLYEDLIPYVKAHLRPKKFIITTVGANII